MSGRTRAGPERRSFSPSGYEVLDEDLAEWNEVVIWSVNPLTPRLGDVFLIESDGAAYDATVEELAIFKGGWSAFCRAAPVEPI